MTLKTGYDVYTQDSLDHDAKPLSVTFRSRATALKVASEIWRLMDDLGYHEFRAFPIRVHTEGPLS